MDFSEALELVQSGKRIARDGWNGRGMFLYYVPAGSYAPSTDIARAYFEGNNVPYQPYIAFKTVDETVVPWVPSQTDILARDWTVMN